MLRADSTSNLHLPASLATQSKARSRGKSEAIAFSHYLVMSSSKKPYQNFMYTSKYELFYWHGIELRTLVLLASDSFQFNKDSQEAMYMERTHRGKKPLTWNAKSCLS